MEDFKISGRKIQARTIEEIEVEYNYLLRQYENKIISIIVDIIYEQKRAFPCSIPESKIEEWVDEYLIVELRSKGRRKFEEIYYRLIESFSYIEKNIENYPSKEKLFEKYEESIEIVRTSIKNSWIEDYFEEFIRNFVRKTEYYFDAFMGINDARFYDNITELKSSIKHKLSTKLKMFCAEYNAMIKNAFENNKKQMNIKIESIDFQQNEEKKFEKYKRIMLVNNFELIQEKGITYSINKTTGQKYELELDKQKNVLNLKNSMISFIIDSPRELYSNKEENKIVCLAGMSILVANSLTPNGYKIEMGTQEYEFYQGNTKCTSPEQIAIIISKLQKDVPIYFQAISKNAYFRKSLEKLNLLEYITPEEPANTPRKK